MADSDHTITLLLTSPGVRNQLLNKEFRKYAKDGRVSWHAGDIESVVTDVCGNTGVPPPPGDILVNLFNKYDKDHDSFLTAEEFGPFFEQLLKRTFRPKDVEEHGAKLKVGMYGADGGAAGTLFLKKRPDMYSFSVVNPSSGSSEWTSRLIKMGTHEDGRGRFWLRGHPEGGFFLLGNDGSLEEVDASYSTRCIWKNYPGGIRGIAAPPKKAGKFPSDNFIHAILSEDASNSRTNDPCSPNIEVVLAACGCFEQGPGQSGETVPWGDFFENYRLPDDPVARQKIMACLYTMECPLYHEMNTALRTDDLSAMKYYSAFIMELREVFKTDHEDQIITPFDGTVYRGIGFPDPDQALGEYQPGDVFVWPSFTSMTQVRETAFNFGNVIFEVKCHPPKEAYDGDIAVYAPASVQEWSFFGSGEGEILFPCNVQFKVVEVIIDEQSGLPLVRCETCAFDTDEGLADFKTFQRLLEQKKAAPPKEPTPVEERAKALLQQYVRVFKAVDVSGDGTLSKREMKNCFFHMQGAFEFAGMSLPGFFTGDDRLVKTYVNQMYQDIDSDKSGSVSFSEMIEYLQKNQGGPEAFGQRMASMPEEEWCEMLLGIETCADAFEMGTHSNMSNGGGDFDLFG